MIGPGGDNSWHGRITRKNTLHKLVKDFMDKQLQSSSRKKFIVLGTAILTFFALPSFFRSSKKVKLLSVDGDIIEVDKAFLKPVPDLPTVSNSAARKGIEGKSFVMVIDLARCKNLKKCQSACNHMHHIHPGENWIKVHPMQDGE